MKFLENYLELMKTVMFLRVHKGSIGERHLANSWKQAGDKLVDESEFHL